MPKKDNLIGMMTSEACFYNRCIFGLKVDYKCQYKYVKIRNEDIKLGRTGLFMYKKSQRKKAIELYILFKFKAALVINILGYSDRRILKKWYDDYIKNDNTVVINHYRRSGYSKADRMKAVDFYLNHGKY